MDANTPKSDRASWIKGPDVACSVAPVPRYPLRMVLLGPPGVGKGTQAEFLCDLLGVCHLSTGDIFRAAKDCAGPRTPAMSAALVHMRKGELVPDDTVMDIVRERKPCLRCRGGFLLDGFPRSVAQAKSLAALMEDLQLKLDVVINYQLPIDEIVARLSGRRTCAGCKAIFHTITRPPKVADVCDHCGGKLYQREDDRAESITVRMAAYNETTSPLITYYQRQGLLVTIDAEGLPAEVLDRTIMTLASLQDPAVKRAHTEPQKA